MKAKLFSVVLFIAYSFLVGCEKDYDFQNSQQKDAQEVGIEIYNQLQEVGEDAATISCQITSMVSISKVYLEYWISADEQNKLIKEMKTSDIGQPYTYTVSLTDLKSDTEYQTAYKIISETDQIIRLSGKSFRTTPPFTENFTYQEGAIHGAIKVSDTKYVAFSKGNLRYNAATNIWSFAANQYDVVGEANKNVSATYNGDIDLFMYGTSGYDSKYAPYYNYDYDIYSNSNYYHEDITNTEYDWGIYNRISNGGDQVGLWRTLSQEEWEYLISHNVVAKAQIGSTKGMIILPINFEYPDGIGTIVTDATYSKNYFNESNWIRMENNGAVFLPIAGYRYNKNSIPNYKDGEGYYWSTTSFYSYSSSYYGDFYDHCYALEICDSGIFLTASLMHENKRNLYCFALSVRLVCNLNLK